MRRVILSTYMTLDGVMEAPEKWVFRFWNDELARANSGQKPEHGAPSVINLADPARGEDANEFQGYRHDAGVLFIVVDARRAAARNCTDIHT